VKKRVNPQWTSMADPASESLTAPHDIAAALAAVRAAIAEACRAQLDESQRRGGVALLGLSLGGMVAAQWASRHPHEVRRCVLINTSSTASPPWHRLRPGAWPALTRIAAGRDARRAEQVVLAWTSAEASRHAHLVELWATIRRQRGVTPRNALGQLLAAARYRLPAWPPGAPVLVVCGARDRLVDPRCSERLADRWQATLLVHPQAGHDLPLDAPQWLIGAIADWTRQLPR
jgi:pimeloyl-ACP methyl ester carboxylesterase